MAQRKSTRVDSKNEDSQADNEELKSVTPRRSSRRLSAAIVLEKDGDDVVDRKRSETPPVKRSTRKVTDKLKKIEEVETVTKAAGKAKRLDALKNEEKLASPRRRSRGIEEDKSETKAAGKEESGVPKAKRLDALKKEGELSSPRRRSMDALKMQGELASPRRLDALKKQGEVASPRRRSRRLSGAGLDEDDAVTVTPAKQGSEKVADLGKIEEMVEESESNIPLKKRKFEMKIEPEVDTVEVESINENVLKDMDVRVVNDDDGVVNKKLPAEENDEKSLDMKASEEIVEEKIKVKASLVEKEAKEKIESSVEEKIEKEIKPLVQEETEKDDIIKNITEKETELENKVELSEINEVPVEEKVKIVDSENIEPATQQPIPEVMENERELENKVDLSDKTEPETQQHLPEVTENERKFENQIDLSEIDEVSEEEKQKIVHSENTEPATQQPLPELMENERELENKMDLSDNTEPETQQQLPEAKAFDLQSEINTTKVPAKTKIVEGDESANNDMEVDNVSLNSTLQQTETSNSTDTVKATQIVTETESKEVTECGDEIKVVEEATETKKTKYNKSETKLKENMLVKAEHIPRQKPKSGKFWKASRSQFNSVKKDQGPRLTFEQRVKRKEEKDRAKELAEMLIKRKIQKKQELKEKMEANKKKKEENERRAEVYQVIKNPAKIKRMKKKQLRLLAKRDTVDMRKPSVLSSA